MRDIRLFLGDTLLLSLPPRRVKVSIFQVLKLSQVEQPVRLRRQVHKFLRCFLHVHRSSFLLSPPPFFRMTNAFLEPKCFINPWASGIKRSIQELTFYIPREKTLPFLPCCNFSNCNSTPSKLLENIRDQVGLKQPDPSHFAVDEVGGSVEHLANRSVR